MNNITKNIGFIIVAIFFASCTKSVQVDLSKYDNKPVLNVLMNQDSLLYVRLTLSERIADGATFKEPTSATLTLTENGIFKENLAIKTIAGIKYYVSNSSVLAGKTYQVKADVAGYGVVSSQDIIPNRTLINVQDLKIVDGQSQDQKVSLISFKVTNTGNQPAKFRYRLFDKTLTMVKDPLQLIQFYPNEGIPDIRLQAERQSFSDGAIQPGESVFYTFRTKNNYNELNLEVTALTDESYKYLKSAALAVQVNGDPTAEKVSVYTNVSNGLGFVGGIAAKDFSIKK